MLLAGCILTGCKKEKGTENPEKPAITIWEVKASSHGVEFMLTPVNAPSYRYAVVRAANQSGTIDYITVNSAITGTFTVDNLMPGTEYIIKAEAVNEAGETVQNQCTFVTEPSPVAYAVVENLVVFHNRIVVNVASSNCLTILYAVSPASASEPSLVQFMSEQTTGTVSLQIGGLTANTEYKLYIYPVNVDGDQGDLIVEAFRTPLNVVQVAVASTNELSNSVTFTLSLTNIATLYHAHTLRGAPEPGAQDYVQKTIENNAQTTTVTVDGLIRGTLYTAYFYGTSLESVSSAVVPRNFEAVDNSINLSLNATANSYICTGLTEYRFNAAVKGNSAESVGTPVLAKLLWTDKANMIHSVTLENQQVRFVLAGYGNGVIAVTDAQDKVLWSWHIYAPEEAVADDRYVNHFGGTYYVMDRNFGAMRSRNGNDCMLYQWGRKDPFPNKADNPPNVFKEGAGAAVNFVATWPPVNYTSAGATNSENIAYSVANPTVFIYSNSANNAAPNYQSWTTTPQWDLWGDIDGHQASYQTGNWSHAKTMYDPCPPGYRVSNAWTATGFTATGTSVVAANIPAHLNVLEGGSWGIAWNASDYGIFRRYPGDTQGTYWPCTGSRNPASGATVRGTQAEHFFSTPDSGGTFASYMQVHGQAVGPKGGHPSSSTMAYGHAVRCVRYKSETQTNLSEYANP